MKQDIDIALQGWEYKPGMVQARLVQARDGRQVLQLRVDLGVLQIEVNGRPDGQRPHGCETYFEYLRRQAQVARRAGEAFVLTEEQCLETDREFIQYYHRRICWLALRNFARALADADHTLALMDFVRDHSPGDDYLRAHEQYRGFVIFHRSQAAAALALEKENPELAIDSILDGLRKIREFYVSFDAEERMTEDPMVQQLREMEQSLRDNHGIQATLREKLEQAVANEEYEAAARLRDELKKRS